MFSGSSSSVTLASNVHDFSISNIYISLKPLGNLISWSGSQRQFIPSMAAGTEKENLRILLVGGGGREHALAWKLSQSTRVDTIFCAPGNGGTGNIDKTTDVPHLSPDQHADLLVFAKESKIDLVVVGPEVPLVAGIVDVCESNGIQCFGPKAKAAARMEGSKVSTRNIIRM